MNFSIEHHGSIVLVRPLDPDTTAALEAGAPDDAQWWCGALAVEPRYLEHVLAYLEAA